MFYLGIEWDSLSIENSTQVIGQIGGTKAKQYLVLNNAIE
jgi:hypothetical protein